MELWTRGWLSDRKLLQCHGIWILTDICFSDHLKALKPDTDSGFWVLGGATLDEPIKEGAGPKINGSIMMAVADSREEVLEKLKQDVYYSSGVWDTDKVCNWSWRKSDRRDPHAIA